VNSGLGDWKMKIFLGEIDPFVSVLLSIGCVEKQQKRPKNNFSIAVQIILDLN